MQVKQLLEQRFPGMEVAGSTFPVPPAKQAAAQAAGLAQMAGFALVAAGERVFEALGAAQPPEWYVRNVAGNRLGAGVGVWFVGNAVRNALVSTGAFEVFYDGDLVFSKLQTGRMPGAEDILAPIARHIEERTTPPEAAAEQRGPHTDGVAAAAEAGRGRRASAQS